VSGTAIKLKQAGCRLSYICTTDARYDYFFDEPVSPREMSGKMDLAAETCCRLIGMDEFLNLNYEDGFYPRNKKTVKEMAKLLRKQKPDMIFTMWPIDNHPDHVNTARVVERAVALANDAAYREGKELATGCKVLALYFNQQGLRQTVGFVPDLYVDVADVMEKVKEVAEQFPSPKTTKKFLDFIELRHAYDGRMARREYAEALAKSRHVGRSWATDPLLRISREVDFPFVV